MDEKTKTATASVVITEQVNRMVEQERNNAMFLNSLDLFEWLTPEEKKQIYNTVLRMLVMIRISTIARLN